MTRPTRIPLLVVGAGPCGLAVGVAARRQGIPCLLVDRGPIVHALERFPLDMTWFSTPELLEIGRLPFVTAGDKPTRSESLKPGATGTASSSKTAASTATGSSAGCGA